MIKDNAPRSSFAQSTPNLRVLTDPQIEEIHYAGMEILTDIGMKLECESAREMLHGHGAYVEGSVVRVPVKLVEQALRSVPGSFTLHTREGEPFLGVQGYNAYYGCNPDNPLYIDPYTGETRKPTSLDAANMGKLIDYLPNIDFINTCNFAFDVHVDIRDRVNIRQYMFNMRKPICFSCKDNDSLKDIIEMGAIAAGSHEKLRAYPYLFHIEEPISPLTHDDTAIRNVMTCAEHEVPLVYFPMTMAGTTAPVTLAGLLAQSHAEIIFGLVVHQLANPGAPFVYGAIPSIMDLKTMKFCYGAPEMWLCASAISDIGHYFKIPIWGTAGPTDSKSIDPQAVAELSYGFLMAGLSGANLIHDIGLMDSADLYCPEIYVLSDELVSMAKVITKGIDVTEENLALPAIRESLETSSFISQDHTLDHFKEIWRPEFFDRSVSKKTEEPVTDKLNRKVKDIFENYVPREFDPDKKRAILELEKKWMM
jgi:trimethylamine--corrinoid protein Co-methyltransferase